MRNEKIILPTTKLARLRAQGYCNLPDAGVSELAFGNRFAYYICSSLLLIGVVSADIPLLSIIAGVAFLGVVLPNHPFDYIYNNLLAETLNKPRLPHRSKQLKFACSIATVWLAVTIYMFYSGFMAAGYILGGILFMIAGLVSTTDICIPSIIYNFIFKVEIK